MPLALPDFCRGFFQSDGIIIIELQSSREEAVMAPVELLTLYMMGKYGRPGKTQSGYFIFAPSLEPRTTHT
jgi:hypothetical protein